ncbi:hypothetical protein CGRA01v4_13287 [Colletotrichum graminicola]|uniref:Uncharacterized protein n=1 Tax=Colletotrichum graminicola (strain M1.001 / M2 / FGSC 10212) TaxID=645133 RepID=E3QQD3_COLGM|nr:uncharacterized protein GLRG_08215 [Colletotrichum graminicola M1.001]EFQ33071.1 hypothetical protein GLRG_08215 [Colletotrichum graminicola M1.001]WDK21997.1 hypothetical protein CGRA01v4_13287 [Colletotrichum graminicola]
MVHLISALLSVALSPTTAALVSAEPFSLPLPHSDESHVHPPSSSLSSSSPSGFSPSPDHARENAAYIFNEVHSAMRQWGSSVHHNGMGLIPATVPKGTLMYHGTNSNSTPEGFEWLAFEMEHSENFARSWRGQRPPPGRGGSPHGGRPVDPTVQGQKPLGGEDDERPPKGSGRPGRPEGPVRGYLHTYRANRDLKLLYIDGMSAGKTAMGTLDTQDYLLRGVDNAPGYGDIDRARDICKIVKAWGLDGVIRMEIGFESIYCDFFDGLDLVSMLRRPWMDQVEGEYGMNLFEWARAVSQRYDGIGAGRVRLDFGGMVSGLWYPLNVTNPNGRGDMPRLGLPADGERGVILGRVEEIVKGAKWAEGKVDWQGIVDMMVSRYADRIEALADEGEDGGDEAFLGQVLVVTNSFVDYPRDASDSAAAAAARGEEDDYVKDARERCAASHLAPATVRRDEWTPEDSMLHAAISTVAERICGDLFDVRGLVLEAAPALASAFSQAEIRDVVAAARDGDGDEDEKLGGAVRRGRAAIQALKRDLGWAGWKRCKPGCGVGEVCFIAMWPFGYVEDHFRPSCHNRSVMLDRWRPGGANVGYWDWEPRMV